MLKSLYEFGMYIDDTEGIETAFIQDFDTPEKGNFIVKLSIDKELSIKYDIIEFNEEVSNKFEGKSLFYKGGNAPYSVTGTGGIMGRSPFLFKFENLKENKVSSSSAYYKKELFIENISDINFVKKFLDFLEENAEELQIKSIEETYSYFLEKNKNRLSKEKEKDINLDFLTEEENLPNNDKLKESYLTFIINKGKEIIKKLNKNNYFRFIEIINNLNWVYIEKFYGIKTEKIHKEYINCSLEQKRKKDFNVIVGNCDVCGKNKQITYPRLRFFALDVQVYTRNLKKLNEISDSEIRIKICKDCDKFITGGWKFLKNLFNGQRYLLLPIVKDPEIKRYAFQMFIKAVRGKELSDFERINELINNKHINKGLELYFIVYVREQQKLKIKKLVKNYKLHSIKFDPNKNRKLMLLENDNETLRYINYRNQGYKNNKFFIKQIKNFFDLERILKAFFVNNKNYPINFYLYELYYRNPPKNMSQNFKHRIYKYRDDLVSFIYDSNFSAIDDKILSDIVLNYLLYEIRNKRKFFGNTQQPELFLKNAILERLNYYQFLKNEILKKGVNIMLKEQILELERLFRNFDEGTNKGKIKDIILQKEVTPLLYYLIGNFIAKIDGARFHKNKNQIFDKFISSLNRRNIKERFQKDILQNQNYYIKGLSRKTKFVFELIKYHLDELFKDLPYEEIMLSLITGYYSNDILKTEKKPEEEEGNSGK